MPLFGLPSNTVKNIGLDDLKGKWGVLYFYPGDFTSGCTIEAQNFEKGSGIIRGLGAEIYGVSVDSLAKHLDFSKKYGLPFALLSDAEDKVSEQSKKTTYLYIVFSVFVWNSSNSKHETRVSSS